MANRDNPEAEQSSKEADSSAKRNPPKAVKHSEGFRFTSNLLVSPNQNHCNTDFGERSTFAV